MADGSTAPEAAPFALPHNIEAEQALLGALLVNNDVYDRIAAILPLPKKRAAVSPTGFTRRYGHTIAARTGSVRRDGLDACVYE